MPSKAPKRPEKATRRSLARFMADEVDMSAQGAYEAISALIEGIQAALADGQTVELRGLGTFHVHERKKRIIQVPSTGPVKVPKRKDVLFRTSSVLEKAVRKKRRKKPTKRKPK